MEFAQRSYEHIDKLLFDYLGVSGPSLSKRDAVKRAREAARSVLPNATETKLVFTVNARALRHILALRGSKDADAEIQVLARKMAEIVKEKAPNIFQDLTIDEAGVHLEHQKV